MAPVPRLLVRENTIVEFSIIEILAVEVLEKEDISHYFILYHYLDLLIQY